MKPERASLRTLDESLATDAVLPLPAGVTELRLVENDGSEPELAKAEEMEKERAGCDFPLPFPLLPLAIVPCFQKSARYAANPNTTTYYCDVDFSCCCCSCVCL